MENNASFTEGKILQPLIMFAGIAIIMSSIMVVFAPWLSRVMNAPKEAFDKTVAL